MYLMEIVSFAAFFRYQEMKIQYGDVSFRLAHIGSTNLYLFMIVNLHMRYSILPMLFFNPGFYDYQTFGF